MNNKQSHKEDDNKKIGAMISLALHIALILLLLIPFLSKQEDIIQTEGILVAFGDPDAGSDDAELVSEETYEKAAPPPTASESSQNEGCGKENTQSKRSSIK